jgi:hypothetical protein
MFVYPPMQKVCKQKQILNSTVSYDISPIFVTEVYWTNRHHITENRTVGSYGCKNI